MINWILVTNGPAKKRTPGSFINGKAQGQVRRVVCVAFSVALVGSRNSKRRLNLLGLLISTMVHLARKTTGFIAVSF